MNHHDVRRIATGLEGAAEQPHHGFASFRVARKTFATLPHEDNVHIMLSPDAIREAVALDPAAVPADGLEALLTEARCAMRCPT